MASNITTAYSTLLSTLATLFPSKTRIPNPYDLEQNPDGFLRDGYGLRVNSSNPEESEFKNYRYELEFSVIFTKEIIRTEEDTTAMETQTLAMLEEMHTVRKDFYNVDQLGIESNIERIDLGTSSGIEFLRGDKFNYAFIEVNFLLSLEELL